MKNIWYPCMSSEDLAKAPPIKVLSAKNSLLKCEDKIELIDAISSWWVNIHGHNNEYLNEALTKQLSNFAHVMTANFTHEPIEKLAEKLKQITFGYFDKVFFASDGSSAIEAALKMSYQYFVNTANKRKSFIFFENAYHGETLGALSVSGESMYKNAFHDILIKGLQAKIPLSDNEIDKAIQDLEKIICENSICAIIIEPLIQCAGGMKMHSPMFLKKLSEIAKKYDIFLILDEIAVGFGRTGTFFAFEQADIKPDFICLSKGLGAGYLPIAATLISKKVADGFCGDISKAFLHSHSHTGNALACAVANAGLELFEKMDYINKNKLKIAQMKDRLNNLASLDGVFNARQCGMVCAVDINVSHRITADVFNLAKQKGVFLRPLGNVIYTMPPYCVTTQEIDKIFDAIEYAIDRLK